MLAVTGIGMVSALGSDVVTSCAAARAGILRASAIEDLFVFDPVAEAPVPVTGCRLPLITRGLFGYSRLLQLALGAIDDLRAQVTLPAPRRGRPVGLVLHVRSEVHRTAWLRKLRENPDLIEGDLDLEREEADLTSHKLRLAESLLGQVIMRGNIEVDSRARSTLLADQAGFVDALEQATRWIAEGACESCWVGSVDSYLDPQTVEALAGLGLLKSPQNPVGLIPGEVGCFLAVEDGARVRQESRKPLAVIDGFAKVPGATSRLAPNADGRPPAFEPMMRALSQAQGDRPTDFGVVNLNGDTVRSVEWGGALIGRRAQGFDDLATTWIPPLHFGEIGAATGSTSVAMLARGWLRGYAPSPRAVVALLEDDTARGAVSISAP